MNKPVFQGSAVAHGIVTPFHKSSRALPPFHVSTKKDAPEWPVSNSFWVKLVLAIWAAAAVFGLVFYFVVIKITEKYFLPFLYAFFS